jgi:hypothetical protein
VGVLGPHPGTGDAELPVTKLTSQTLCVHPLSAPGVHCTTRLEAAGATFVSCRLVGSAAGVAVLTEVLGALASLFVDESVQVRLTVNW